jgi:hypothetical protein
MLINKQQFWSIDSALLHYFRQKWIVSALGIKQQTGPLILLFLFSQYRQSTFWFRVETYICVGDSGPFEHFNWTGNISTIQF